MEYKNREAKAPVLGVQAQMMTFDYFYGFRLGILLLRHSDNLNAPLQTKNLCVAETQTIAKHTVATLQKMRTDENCHQFWEDVKQKATKLDVDAPKLSRKRRALTRIEEFFGGKAAPEYANDAISQYRRIYFESLDCIINSIENLVDQEDFRTYVNLEHLLLKAAKGDVFIQEYNDAMAIYGSDFDENRFQVQLEALQEYCTNLDGNIDIRSVTDTLWNLTVQSRLGEVFKLSKLILVLPATNATSERTFSLLKLIKSYLRSTMKQSRLNRLMILSACKNKLDELDLTKIASDFINKNGARKHIFGKFN